MKTKKKKLPNYRERVKRLEKTLDLSWSKVVRERDGRCRLCGGNSTLAAHHAFGRTHKSTRWDLENGVALCWPCHKFRAHGDPAGFAVWFEGQVGKDQYARLSEAHNIPALHTEDDLRGILETITSMAGCI